MATVYPGMKPMLEFVQTPERVEVKRRRRKCAVRTPEHPRVKTVPLCEQVTQPPNVKWVSPQFSTDTAQVRPRVRRGALEIKTSKRTALPLQFDEEEDSPHISVYPSLAPHLVHRLDCDQMRDTEETNCTQALSNTHSSTIADREEPTMSPDQELPDQTVPDVPTLEHPHSQMSVEDSDVTRIDEESCAVSQTVPDVPTLENPHSQMSVEDSDVTRIDDESCAVSSSTFHLSLGCIEDLEELSEQIGCMSLEDTSCDAIDPSLNSVPVSNYMQLEQSEYPQSRYEFTPNDLPKDKVDDVSKNKFDHLDSSSHKTTQGDNVSKDKGDNFKPPSTSTPCRLKDISLNQAPNSHFSQFSKLTNSSSKLPANSDFVLHLTDSNHQDVEAQLDSHELTDTSHTTCKGCTVSDDSSFILAAETPQHLWCSPEVKVIDNTFS